MSGNEMCIHKYMLYARFPNMSQVFRYRTAMEMPPSIEIEISDQIFELFMHYICTGKLRDSYVTLELFRYAEHLGLSSLIQCVMSKPAITMLTRKET
ncbi:hypothetical protein AVEN_184425-1 [Araneus ventricosus]|uniref:BTB domain-containing protein n=1 Tax=Araneus ventricosus TaxID=182803 RepID=A0A4Y2BHK1_ARAVE|nr:hypothetical protein AVEN_184425-1 [Araneus ventricosus]